MKTTPSYKNILQKLVLVLSIFFNTLIVAQTYPVQVTPQLIPPYSLKISDYATTTSEKLYVNILLTDVNEVGRRVRLKMYIEGQGLAITTQDVIIGETPIYLDGGINTRLSNLDLQPYFQLNNLVGITPGQYNSPLPNGGYDFCFEVYDYFTNHKLSGKNCTTAYLLQNDPPILNLPFNDNIITATNPQNILFTWTPRHSNVSNVQYEYTLKELWDVQNPQASFLASVPFYQTTTHSTTLLVGPEAPQLLSGKIYGWQVRAFVSDGINETSVFKNDGKSEIFWFKYLEDCSAPTFVISQALTAESVQVNWQISDHLRYRIQYRKKGFSDDDWFEVNSYTNEGKIFNLEANTVYEFRVGGECTQLSGFAYSNIQEFTTPTTDEAAYYNCGLMPQINITNKEPLPKLGVNETFTAGDFPVVTREVSGSNGTFSGWGYITLPFLENIKEIVDAVNIVSDAILDDGNDKNGSESINIGKFTRIKVVFSGVSINSSYQLTDGVVVTDYDANWSNIIDIDDLVDDIAGDDGDVSNYDASNLDIKDVDVDDSGNIVVTTEDGETHVVISDKPVTITDKNGDQWTVKEDGSVEEGKAADGGVPNKDNTSGVASSGSVKEITSKDVRVKFIPSGYYSTDKYNENIKSSKYKKEYEFVKTHDKKEYSVLYKLISDIPDHENDIIKAEVTFANGKTQKDVVFKTKQGVKVETTWSNDSIATLALKRRFKFAKDEILATVKPKDSTKKYTVAGKLNTWHAQQKNINLTLVSVNGTPISGVGDRINKIYNKAGIKFNIKEDNLTLNIKSLEVGDSDLLSHYTEDEKTIINAFKKKGTKKDQYYLFFLDDDKVDLKGFMPLKRQFGFVFKTKDAGRIAAHELGHGIFGLKHPFDQYNASGAKEENHYLMNNGEGIAFSHMDWQKLHAPGIQLYWFQGDEAGEFANSYALTPNFKFVYINNSKTIHTRATRANMLITGTLPGFKIVNPSTNKVTKEYTWNFVKERYVNDRDSTDVYSTTLRNKLPQKKSVNLFFNLNKGCGQKSYINLSYDEIKDHQEAITSGKNGVEQKIINMISSYTSTRSKGIACSSDVEANSSVWREISIDCTSPDILDLLENDIKKIGDLVNETNNAKIVEVINQMHYKCVFENVDKEKLSKLFFRLGSDSTIRNGQEKAIVKLLRFIGKDDVQNFVTKLKEDIGQQTLFENLVKRFDDSVFYIFGDNNETSLLHLLANRIKKLTEDQDKWYFINTLIKIKYDKVVKEENKKVFIYELLATTKEYLNLKDKMPRLVDLFANMLIDDCKGLSDYKIVFDLSIDRLNNREAFSTFTQGDKIDFKIKKSGKPDAFCTAKVNSVFSDWSWVKPVNFGISCGPSELVDVIYTNHIINSKTVKINDVFVWAKYYWEHKSTLDDLFSNNLVEYLKIFKEQLNIHLKNVKVENSNFWKDTNIVCDNLKDIFNQININENSTSLSKVDSKDRLKILKTYFSCTNDFSSVSFQEIDNALLKLLSSFDDTDVSILKTIEEIGIDSIFDKLKAKETSKTIGKIAVWMGGQIHNTGHFKDVVIESLINDKGEFKKEKLLGLESDLDIFKFGESIDNFSSTIKNKNQFKIKDQLLDYNQKVVVYVAGDFEFLGQKFKQGSVITMPMIQAYAMSNSNRAIVNDKIMWLSIDAVTMVFGVGEVMVFFKAGNIIRKSIVALDLVSSAAGIAETLINNNTLSPEGRFKLQMISIATSIPSMLTSIKKVDNLVYTIDDILSEVNTIKNIKEKTTLLEYVKVIKKRLKLDIETRIIELGYTVNETNKIVEVIKKMKLKETSINSLLIDIKSNSKFKDLLKTKPSKGVEAWNILKKYGEKICN
ncbi:fibronectin type III domain-containing protein [uncultured Tenacibaculum sp.]|uniref:fibronectin type III domain-containing protein n=1 Tax=uncultured Tenacibaculum sp. TaxID=174713 RepID=UPI0026245E2B|nr:fibronectin type III domain-containing protein [uncultured Tenacibaculum sp.]